MSEPASVARLLLVTALLGLGVQTVAFGGVTPRAGAARRAPAFSPAGPVASLPQRRGRGRALLGGLRAKGGELVETGSKRADAAAMRYWDGMNRRDIDFAMAQFADDIFFQDMMFPKPFVSKEQLRNHFETCLKGFPEDLRFVIDEISTDSGDGKCGAYWHCETPLGRAFPFSRGVSFYKVNAVGKIVFAREIPEPSTKAGKAGLGLARAGAFLLKYVPESIQWPKI